LSTVRLNRPTGKDRSAPRRHSVIRQDGLRNLSIVLMAQVLTATTQPNARAGGASNVTFAARTGGNLFQRVTAAEHRDTRSGDADPLFSTSATYDRNLFRASMAPSSLRSMVPSSPRGIAEFPGEGPSRGGDGRSRCEQAHSIKAGTHVQPCRLRRSRCMCRLEYAITGAREVSRGKKSKLPLRFHPRM